MKLLKRISTLFFLATLLISCAHDSSSVAKSPQDDSPLKTKAEQRHQRIADMVDKNRF